MTDIPWNITFTQETLVVDYLSTFDDLERHVVLKGTMLKDVFGLYVAGKFKGVVVGTDPEKLDAAVRARLGEDCHL